MSTLSVPTPMPPAPPVAVPRRYTVEDLLTMPDGDRYELVDGQLKERKMGSLSSWVAGETFRRIANFNAESRQGWVWPEGTGFQCFPFNPNLVRKPDTSFIRFGRLLGETPAMGFERIAPDLAVEVISPNDLAAEIDEKIQEYQRAGVRLIWIINPGTRTVQVIRPDGSGNRLTEREELTGEDVLPGFRCHITDLFPPVPTTTQTLPPAAQP